MSKSRRRTVTHPPKRAAKKTAPKRPKKVLFHYIKAEQFRTIQVDGIYGGISSPGKINLSLFSERRAIPRTISKEVIDADRGILSNDDKIEDTVGGVVRQVEINTSMDLDTAESIALWLSEKVEELKKLRTAALEELRKDLKKEIRKELR